MKQWKIIIIKNKIEKIVRNIIFWNCQHPAQFTCDMGDEDRGTDFVCFRCFRNI